MKQHSTHDIKVTDNTRPIRWRWRVNFIYVLYDYFITWEKENLFVYAEPSPVKHAASQFSIKKIAQKKEKKEQKQRVTPGWTDISVPGPIGFLSRSCMYKHYADST